MGCNFSVLFCSAFKSVFFFFFGGGGGVGCLFVFFPMFFRAGENGFQSGGTMEQGKELSLTMYGREEKILDIRHSRMATTVAYYPR